jgi:hypothetical protein
MGGLVLILPVLAFDFWLLATTGRKRFRQWARTAGWPRLAGTVAVGLALGVWLAFFVHYKWGDKTRVTGFPIPAAFASLEDVRWIATEVSPVMRGAALAVNLLSGLAATMIPSKFAEFLQSVKAELAR